MRFSAELRRVTSTSSPDPSLPYTMVVKASFTFSRLKIWSSFFMVLKTYIMKEVAAMDTTITRIKNTVRQTLNHFLSRSFRLGPFWPFFEAAFAAVCLVVPFFFSDGDLPPSGDFWLGTSITSFQW